MKFVKCKDCEKLILPDDLVKIQAKDKEGNLKFTITTKPQMYNLHKKCLQSFEDKQNEYQDRRKLTDYLKEKYFYISFPPVLAQYLINIRNCGEKFNHQNKVGKGYSYDIIHRTFLKIEEELYNVFLRMENNKMFQDDLHKVNFILFNLKKHIDTFAKEFEVNKKIQKMKEIENTIENSTSQSNIVIQKTKNKYIINDLL